MLHLMGGISYPISLPRPLVGQWHSGFFTVSPLSLISQTTAKSLISDSISVAMSLIYNENINRLRTVPCVTYDEAGTLRI